MLSGRTRHDLLLRGQRLSSHPHAGDPRLSLSPRAPIPPTASLCPRLRGCSRTATSAAPRAYDTCPHVSLTPHDPHLPARLPPCSPAHALRSPPPRQGHPPTFRRLSTPRRRRIRPLTRAVTGAQRGGVQPANGGLRTSLYAGGDGRHAAGRDERDDRHARDGPRTHTLSPSWPRA
jgi:hypothetical protein